MGIFSGEVELDESYLSSGEKRQKRSGVQNKVSVVGVLKRDGKVYTQVIRNVSKSEIRSIINHLLGRQVSSTLINEELMTDWC